jgi:hypothetical protein
MACQNWLNKPDGTEGWASWFIKKGYEIYITDQAYRGRSGFWPNSDITFSITSNVQIQQLFTAPELYNLYPQAKLHTQWPGVRRNYLLHCNTSEPSFSHRTVPKAIQSSTLFSERSSLRWPLT